MHRIVVAFLLLGVLSGCDATSSDPEDPADALPPGVASYLNAALDTMKTAHVRRKEVDWPSFRAKILDRAVGDTLITDTYDDIRYALNELDDHSYFLPPQKSARQKAPHAVRTDDAVWTDDAVRSGKAIGDVEGHRLTAEAGYVDVPSISGGGMEALKFADRLQSVIASTDSTSMCGWVVDLRDNPGGNMWPMVAGIGPIVGEGHLGSFVPPDADTVRWGYRNGASRVRGRTVVRVSGEPYTVNRPAPPVAVLLGSRTASSGEAVAVAFQERNRTRTFGWPTAGLTTAIRLFRLRDGARLGLAVSRFADRTGRVYEGPIVPEVRAPGESPANPSRQDDVVGTARAWVEAHPACSDGT